MFAHRRSGDRWSLAFALRRESVEIAAFVGTAVVYCTRSGG
jgi:hypothetical protein